MAIANHLKYSDWLNIKTQYEAGVAIRELARRYDISHGTIQNRIKKEGWTKEISAQVIEIRKDIQKVSQVANADQLDILGNIIKKDVDDIFLLAKSISNLQKGALNLHGMILKDTLSKTKSGEISSFEASKIVQSQGLSVDKIAAMAGISKDKSTVNIQNNQQQTTDSQSEKVIINIKGFEK